MKGISNIVGVVAGLTIVAIVAANPDFLKVTFSGAQGILGTAISPVTGKKK